MIYTFNYIQSFRSPVIIIPNIRKLSMFGAQNVSVPEKPGQFFHGKP